MLDFLTQRIVAHEDKISEWIGGHLGHVKGPIYASVDIRNAGYKIAPVDTNIFPGGFNNLCPSYLRNGSEHLKAYVDAQYPEAKKIMVIPENHSRNVYYFSNVSKILEMIEGAGFEVRVGTLRDDFEGPCIMAETAEGKELELCKLYREGNKLNVKGVNDDESFCPDLLLLNNDLSEGIPEILNQIDQPLIPSPHVGWHSRTKSDHFQKYRDLIREFATLIDIDPWLLESDFVQVAEVDFGQKEGLEKIAVEVDAMIERVAKKYQEYSVGEVPYAFIKNDAGTYGMAITTARSGDELLEMNRKKRNKMNVGKGSMHVGSVIVQEGVPTIDRFKGLVAEPVVYLVGNQPVGGFFRLNELASNRDNLNSKGMKFTKLCFHEMLGYSNEYKGECDLECLAKIYKLLSQIASIAAGYEIIDVEL